LRLFTVLFCALTKTVSFFLIANLTLLCFFASYLLLGGLGLVLDFVAVVAHALFFAQESSREAWTSVTLFTLTTIVGVTCAALGIKPVLLPVVLFAGLMTSIALFTFSVWSSITR